MFVIFGWIVLGLSFLIYPMLGSMVIDYYEVGQGLHENVAGFIAVVLCIAQYQLASVIDRLEQSEELR